MKSFYERYWEDREALIEKILRKKAIIEHSNENRIGDHIWYVSNVSKFKSHYPEWKYTYSSEKILEELCNSGHF